MLTMMGQPVNDVLRTKLRRVGVEDAEWDRIDDWHRTIAEHVAEGQAKDAMGDHLMALRSL